MDVTDKKTTWNYSLHSSTFCYHHLTSLRIGTGFDRGMICPGYRISNAKLRTRLVLIISDTPLSVLKSAFTCSIIIIDWLK
jgi:hypothetical protein